MRGTRGTIANTVRCWVRTLDCCRGAATFLAALIITACSSASKEVVTYHVEFVVDGTPYRAITEFEWYHADNFSYSFSTITFDNAFIHGSLKDGTKYIVSSSDINYLKFGSAKVDSRIYLKIMPGLVESFDKTHTHSQRHIVQILNSCINISSEQRVWYHEAMDAKRAYDASVKNTSYYYTVGAKVTPFNDAGRALSDYFNMGPPNYPAPSDYKKPEFNFHPGNDHIDNSDGDMIFDGKSFNVAFPISGVATTWVLAPHVHIVGIAVSGQRPDIMVNMSNERIIIPPLTSVKTSIDPATGKAVIFYQDDASLRF